MSGVKRSSEGEKEGGREEEMEGRREGGKETIIQRSKSND